MMYYPDEWLVIRIKPTNIYRVFASWYGGYTLGDSWRINSGITKVMLLDEYYYFNGYSGSTYECHKDYYGISPYGSRVLSGIIENIRGLDMDVEIMHRNTDFMSVKYSLQ
jgi:hypothetical protein